MDIEDLAKRYPSVIRARAEHYVTFRGERTSFADAEVAKEGLVAAVSQLRLQLRLGSYDCGEPGNREGFGGSLAWGVDTVAATPFDGILEQILNDYSVDLSCMQKLDREAAVLLHEGSDRSNASWLTTHASLADALAYQRDQEYAADWEIVNVYDTKTGEELPVVG